MLAAFYKPEVLEAGLDEAGRGCLAGPVFAAAVVLPPHFFHPLLNDSKQLTEKERNALRVVIEKEALAFTVAQLCNRTIDEINILQASVQAMHGAVAALSLQPQHLIVDGNYFRSYGTIPYTCVVGGDARFASIAAASVLAKTYRDEYMKDLHRQYPQYDWLHNKGYGTARHRQALIMHGPTPYHRQSFRLDYTAAC